MHIIPYRHSNTEQILKTELHIRYHLVSLDVNLFYADFRGRVDPFQMQPVQ